MKHRIKSHCHIKFSLSSILSDARWFFDHHFHELRFLKALYVPHLNVETSICRWFCYEVSWIPDWGLFPTHSLSPSRWFSWPTHTTRDSQWVCLCGVLNWLAFCMAPFEDHISYSTPIVFRIAGDRMSAILNPIQSGPFLQTPSIFEQAAKPSSPVHSPFVFGQSLSQQPQPHPQLPSKSVRL